MSRFLDALIRKTEPDIQLMHCLSSSGDSEIVEYEKKEDRSSKITYEGIGKVKYGSGIPPAVYDNAVAAVKAFPIVYGCITARSEAIAPLGIKIFDLKGGQEGEVKDHTFYQTFSNPNPYQGSFEFLEQVSQSLDVTGNAFIALEGTNKLLEMYLLPTKYVAIIPDPKTKIKEYLYYINGQSIEYKPEEIIHIRYTDIDDAYYGAPPLASANDVLTFENYRIQFVNQFFKNGAVPVGLLETDAVLGDSLLKKLRGEWEKIHGGIKNAHKVAILQGGLKYKSLTSPLKELELNNLKRLSKEDIQMIFKVPDAILGSMEGTGGKEGKDSLTMFWRNSLIPHLTRIESALNRGLKKTIFKDGKQVFRFNLKTVAALSDDKESTATYLNILLSGSVMTPNEARAIVGLPPSTDPNADKLYISNSQFGNQLIPTDQANNPQANNTEKPTVKPGKPAEAAPAVKPPKKEYTPEELEEFKVKRDQALASTGQVKFTKAYLEKNYGFKSEDIELVNDARTLDIISKEMRLSNNKQESAVSAIPKHIEAGFESFKSDVVTIIDNRVGALAEQLTDEITEVKSAVSGVKSDVSKQQGATDKLATEFKIATKTQTTTAASQQESLKGLDQKVSTLSVEVAKVQVAVKHIEDAEPKQMEVTINNPPMELNLTVDNKQAGAKKTTIKRDADGHMIEAIQEEVSE